VGRRGDEGKEARGKGTKGLGVCPADEEKKEFEKFKDITNLVAISLV